MMPRTETLQIGFGRRYTTQVVETFTHKMVTEDGRLLRSDGADLWLERKATGVVFSMYGEPPLGWDWSKAVPEEHNRLYTLGED